MPLRHDGWLLSRFGLVGRILEGHLQSAGRAGSLQKIVPAFRSP